MELTREYAREKLLEARKLIKENGKLEIIYMRVSTKNKGQQEGDQLKDIITTFDIDPEKCLIIEAKESAFKIEKQKKRLVNIIPIINKKFSDVSKIVYVWDLDRLFRRWKVQGEFIKECTKYKCHVISYRQKFLFQMKDQVKNGLGEVLYDFFLDIFGWMNEEESRKKRDRVIKSLTKKDGVTYTNNNNIFGRRIVKSISKRGNKTYCTLEEVEKIEKVIIKLFNKDKTYEFIRRFVQERTGIKLSQGFIHKTKVKFKYLLK